MQILLAFAYRQQGLLKESEVLAPTVDRGRRAVFPRLARVGADVVGERRVCEAALALARASELHADSRVELGLARHLAGERDAAATDMRDALAAVGLSASHAWWRGASSAVQAKNGRMVARIGGRRQSVSRTPNMARRSQHILRGALRRKRHPSQC